MGKGNEYKCGARVREERAGQPLSVLRNLSYLITTSNSTVSGLTSNKENRHGCVSLNQPDSNWGERVNLKGSESLWRV